jgi:DNA-binding response OmpR family regulator
MTTISRVLVVEDEPLIAMMLEDFLDALGCEVVGVADTVASGLALIRTGGFDAAILDLNLVDGESSDPIAVRLREMGIPFAVSSGDAGATVRFGDRPRLVKPYTISDLERIMGEMDRVEVATG